RRVHGAARLRDGLQQHRVRGRGDGQRERRRRRNRQDQGAHPHASSRPPFRAKSATPPSTTPSAPRIRATISRVELPPPPPPSELTASIVGAGESLLSGPDQLTTVPSE